MDKKEFHKVMGKLSEMDSRQYRMLKQRIIQFEQENEIAHLLESDITELRCPSCNGKSFTRWGVRSKLQRYRCKDCGRTFNSLVNTPLARLKKKDLWLQYARCLEAGVTIKEAARKCQVAVVTSFKWRHRFLCSATEVKATTLSGIIEAKEQRFRYSEKGKRVKSRDTNRNKKVCVFFAVDRSRNTYDKILDNWDLNTLLLGVPHFFAKDALFCTDNKQIYRNFSRSCHLRHGFVDLKKGMMVKKDIVHLKNVSGYQRRFLTWLSRFHGVATKYLDSYLSWFRELEELGEHLEPKKLIIRAKDPCLLQYQPQNIISYNST